MELTDLGFFVVFFLVSGKGTKEGEGEEPDPSFAAILGLW